MVNLHGLNVPDGKIVHTALQLFYGVGPNVASRICAKFSIHKTALVSSLTQPKITSITSEMSRMVLDTDLKRKIADNISRLREIGAYRGKRHALGLPVRGQRTKKQVVSVRKFNKVQTNVG